MLRLGFRASGFGLIESAYGSGREFWAGFDRVSPFALPCKMVLPLQSLLFARQIEVESA